MRDVRHEIGFQAHEFHFPPHASVHDPDPGEKHGIENDKYHKVARDAGPRNLLDRFPLQPDPDRKIGEEPELPPLFGIRARSLLTRKHAIPVRRPEHGDDKFPAGSFAHPLAEDLPHKPLLV